MKYLGLAGLLLSASMLSTPAAAQSIECGGTYTVKSGDFLSAIAKRVYGDSSSYTLIYSANADIIGSNPGLIQVGDDLRIPCLDEAPVPSRADASVIRIIPTTEQVPAPANNRPIRVLTAGDWAPFADEDQAQGGMLTELINVALAEADGSPDYKIDFINDWGAHLQPLLTDHAYDFSIGWTRPDCELGDKLQPESQFRCNNLAFSEPLYEELIGFFTLASGDVLTGRNSLVGKRICRPTDYTIAPLEAMELSEPEITIVWETDPEACAVSLRSGASDVALLQVDVAQGHFRDLGMENEVRLNEQVTYVSTLHAVIAKTNPMAEAHLASVDSGLRKIKQNGEWFEIVRRHMSEFENASQ